MIVSAVAYRPDAKTNRATASNPVSWSGSARPSEGQARPDGAPRRRKRPALVCCPA